MVNAFTLIDSYKNIFYAQRRRLEGEFSASVMERMKHC
jgi:hypothetical protein